MAPEPSKLTAMKILAFARFSTLLPALAFCALSTSATTAHASDETATATHTIKLVTFSDAHHPLSLSPLPFGRLITDFPVDASTKLPAGKNHFTLSSWVTFVTITPLKYPDNGYITWRYFDTSACASSDDACQLKVAAAQCVQMKFEQRVLWKKAGTASFVEVSNQGFRGRWTSGIGAHCGPDANRSYANDNTATYAAQGFGKVPMGPGVDMYRTVVEAGLNTTNPAVIASPTSHWMVKSEMTAAP